MRKPGAEASQAIFRLCRALRLAGLNLLFVMAALALLADQLGKLYSCPQMSGKLPLVGSKLPQSSICQPS